MKFFKCLNEKKNANKNIKWYIRFVYEFENNEFESTSIKKAPTKEEAVRRLKDNLFRSQDLDLVEILSVSDSKPKK